MKILFLEFQLHDKEENHREDIEHLTQRIEQLEHELRTQQDQHKVYESQSITYFTISSFVFGLISCLFCRKWCQDLRVRKLLP